MRKRVFRPFWSLDIIRTEKWLKEMDIKGYHLRQFNTVTKVFIFEKCESKGISYRILHHKSGINISSQSLIKNGWYSVYSKGRWSILGNEKDEAEIKIYPSREGILNRNRIISYIMLAILLIYSVMSLLPMFLFSYILFHLNATHVSGDKLSIVTLLVIPLIVVSSLLYVIVKLNKSEKKLRIESGTDLNLSFTIPKDTILNHKTEKELRKAGKIIKKVKIAWFYAPDRTEEWLENMEIKGYNLYRMSKLGNSFYFMKGEPRKVKYCMDYQSKVNDSYYEIHKLNGWKMFFTSISSFMKYTLWSKEYKEEIPELYSDSSHILKHARKQCMIYCIIYIPMIIMYIWLIALNVVMYLKGFNFALFLPLIFIVGIAEFGYFVITSIGYYLRIRKKIS